MSSPKPLFFSGSDEEDVTAASGSKPKALFFAGSTSEEEPEDDEPMSIAQTEDSFNVFPPPKEQEQCYINDIVLEEIPRASSSGDMSSSGTRPSTPTPASSIHWSSPPPLKKRRVSPQTAPNGATPFQVAYLGTFVVGNAWSTVKGKGYAKPGDYICIERDEQEDDVPKLSKMGSSRSKYNGKGKKENLKGKGKTKQLSIATMLKPPAAKPAKKKTNSVVRLTNKGGFEFGRLPQDVAAWVSKLLDMGIIDFRDCLIVDCPPVLHSGCDLVISLSVYIRASAFKSPHTQGTSSEDRSGSMFNEGQETAEEQVLRERKSSLLRLFNFLGLNPRSTNTMLQSRSQKTFDGELDEEVLEPMTQRQNANGRDKSPETLKNDSKRKVKTEVVGDGEEVEVEGEDEELSENELNIIYKRAQKNDRTMGEMEPVDSFTLTLRGYQKQALLWMHSLETGTMDAREAMSMDPLWEEYVFPSKPDDDVIDLTTEETPFYFNPYSGQLSLEFPKAERKCRGGILADEMGMGKSIMVSALIQTNRDPDPPGIQENISAQDPTLKRRQLRLDDAFRPIKQQQLHLPPCSAATLIVAPTSLLSQWSDELHRSSQKGTLNVLVWHGQNRLDIEAAVAGKNAVDVVITSYGVLASEHAKSEKHSSPVFDLEWLRVVLDEAHHCKSRSSKTARAVYALRAKRRWALTGTPIVNKLEDLFSLLKFLGFAPWSDYSFFRSFITLPFLARDPKAIEIVQVILESVLLRREKSMRDSDGNKIVDLPAKEVTVETLQFSPLERKIYDSIYIDAKKNFERLNAQGLVGKNYSHILAMLMRLRQAVLHPSLVLSKLDEQSKSDGSVNVDAIIKQFASGGGETEGNAFAEGVLAKLDTELDGECPICLDVMDRPILLPGCMHRCCKDCVVAFLQGCKEKAEEGRCPTCSRGPVKESDLLEVVRPKQRSQGSDGDGVPPSSQESVQEVILRRNDFQTSTKLEALIENLRRLQDQDPCFRAVIFSQFTSFLDLIEVVLQRERLVSYRFDGSMDMKKRSQAVAEFSTPSRRPKILVISLKAGGVGLNLTSANHVFMMDCWWNSAAESQAIDRVHRIGQDKPVYVKHFIIANTVEGRILQIQKKKTAIVKEAFRGSGGEDTDAVENLKLMFGDD